MPPWALPVWVSGPGLPAGNPSNSAQKRGRRKKERRKAILRRSTLKRNSMPAPEDICFHRCAHPMWLRLALRTHRAKPRWCAVAVGAGARVWNEKNSCCSGADGSDDESLSERGRSKWRRKWEARRRRATRKRPRGAFTASTGLEKHNFRREGLFWAHADYSLLLDS